LLLCPLMVIQKSGRQCGQRRHNRESREDAAPAKGDRQAGDGVSGKHAAQIADPIDDAGGGRAGFAAAHVQGNGSGQIGIWTEQEEGHQADENYRPEGSDRTRAQEGERRQGRSGSGDLASSRMFGFYAALTTRRRRRSKFARPYIERLISFKR
jgi:hypothetical protein